MFLDDLREAGWLLGVLFVGAVFTVILGPISVLIEVLNKKRNEKFAIREMNGFGRE